VALTYTVKVVGLDGTERTAGKIENRQEGSLGVPAWTMSAREVLTATYPWRDAADGAGAALNDTVPGPEPERPSVTVIQDADATAVQEQPVGIETPREPAPPATVNVWTAGVNVRAVQFDVGAAGVDELPHAHTPVTSDTTMSASTAGLIMVPSTGHPAASGL
jgi:hypothetical protein